MRSGRTAATAGSCARCYPRRNTTSPEIVALSGIIPIMLPSTPNSLRSMVACAVTRTAPSSSTATFVCSGNGAVVPLTVSCARRSTMSPSMRLGAGDHHADVGKLLCFEEVRGAQVIVALADLGVHRCGLDIDAAENRLGVRDLAVTAELREVALDGGEAPHRLGLEPDRRPPRIDVPDADGCRIAQKLLCACHVTSAVNRPTPAAGPSPPGRSTRRCD